jgi:hypothetical protein
MTLRPLLATRIANTLPGGFVALFGLEYDQAHRQVVVVLAVIAGVTLAVRGYRVGVECTAEQAIVRGHLWTRSVRRDSIFEVTSFPALRWRTSGGRVRWTPVLAFADSSGMLPFVLRHSEECTERLEHWARPPRRRRRQRGRRPG